MKKEFRVGPMLWKALFGFVAGYLLPALSVWASTEINIPEGGDIWAQLTFFGTGLLGAVTMAAKNWVKQKGLPALKEGVPPVLIALAVAGSFCGCGTVSGHVFSRFGEVSIQDGQLEAHVAIPLTKKGLSLGTHLRKMGCDCE